MKITILMLIGIITTFLLFNPEAIDNKIIQKEKTSTPKTKKKNSTSNSIVKKIQKTIKKDYERITKKPENKPEQTCERVYINSFKKGDIVKCKLTGKRLLITNTRCANPPFVKYTIYCRDENYNGRWYDQSFLTY